MSFENKKCFSFWHGTETLTSYSSGLVTRLVLTVLMLKGYDFWLSKNI